MQVAGSALPVPPQKLPAAALSTSTPLRYPRRREPFDPPRCFNGLLRARRAVADADAGCQVRMPCRLVRAFSSEVDTCSREANATKKPRAQSRFNSMGL